MEKWEFINKTIEVLKGGWIKGSRDDGDGGHCVAGAFEVVASLTNYSYDELELMAEIGDAANELFPELANCPDEYNFNDSTMYDDQPHLRGFAFNNAPDTTLDDMIVVLEKVGVRENV